ncbi:MAG: dihydrofolate reductase family protein [Bacteroidota bacterium]
MRKLSAFSFITLNGFTHGTDGDISWHRHGEEENHYASESLKPGNVLLFGRVTYEMMASYWPTPMAAENDPVVAAGMNKALKIVFSTTLKSAGWENTRIISSNVVEAVMVMKNQPGPDITILGSGSILSQLAGHGLVDEYQIMIDPVAIGSGVPVFNGIGQKLELNLTGVQTFKSGVVLLGYVPR